MATLLLLGGVLAVANIWFAAVRSTIPLRLDGKVIEKRQLGEKHPGKDDVYLLELPQQVVQVDGQVFETVNEGATIRKQPWSRRLEQHGRVIHLEWSADYHGMLWAMSGSVIVMLVTAFVVQATTKEHPSESLTVGNQSEPEGNP